MPSLKSRLNNVKGISVFILTLFAFALSLSFFSGSFASSMLVAPSVKKAIDENYGKVPLYFIKNEGQMDKSISFYEKGKGHATFFANDGVYLSLVNGGKSYDGPERADAGLVKLNFLNADKSPLISAEGELEGKVNFYTGGRENWKTDVPTFSTVIYKEVYKGVDLKFYGSGGQFEYDVIVSPGVDPSVVRFSYEGISGMDLNSSGDLELGLAGGVIIQKSPVIYQDIDGRRVDVKGSFAVDKTDGAFSYGFNIASYDRSRPLIIDPIILSYSTYLGDGSDDTAWEIVVDTSGNAYVVGETASINFDRLSGLQMSYNGGTTDAFITKMNSNGTALVWSTYLGGSLIDRAYDVAIDSSNNIYVTGQTQSSNFPTTTGAYQTSKADTANYGVFVTKMNSSGTLTGGYSTYIHATIPTLRNDSGYGIAVDNAGNAYVTGRASSYFFPTAGTPYQGLRFGGNGVDSNDAFVLKLNPAGSDLVFSTLIGGGGQDYAFNLALDTTGTGPGGTCTAALPCTYITGYTASTNFPTTTGVVQGVYGGGTYDAFVTKVNAYGSGLVYSTNHGGSLRDFGRDIGVDSSGNAYVMGLTDSSNFPTVSAMQGTHGGGTTDAFLTKFNPSGSARLYSTYIGGSGVDEGHGLAISPSEGFVIITGQTASANFPTARATYKTGGTTQDAFVLGMNPTGTLDFSSYLGGSTGFGLDAGLGVAMGDNAAYITGYTSSGNFPVTGGVFQATQTLTAKEVFISKFLDQSPNLQMDLWSKDFGSRESGSGAGTPQVFTISNQGTVNLVVSNIALTGPNPGSFVLNVSGGGSPCGSTTPTIAASGSCTVTVAFSPQSATSLSAYLTITSNDAGSPDDIGLSGVGTAATAPVIGITPTSKNYGTVLIGQTSTQVFTISNTGTASLNVSGMSILAQTITGPFSYNVAGGGTPCGSTTPTIAVSGNCTISVTYTPSAAVTSLYTLSITSNDPSTPTLNVNLSGTGQTPVPEIDVTPTTKAFGNVQVGQSSAAQAFNIANLGTASLTVSGISLTGTNSGDFSLNLSPASGCGSAAPTVGTSSSCNVAVTCTPSAGAKTANLTITSNDSDESTLNLPLTCTGTVTPQYALDVTMAGAGSGTVTSSPAGITCPGDCTQNYDQNTVVTLTAAASTGSTFTGWSGAGGCTGTGTCVLTMTAAKAATATFTLNTYTLSYTKAGTGSGTVSSSPAGINAAASSTTADFNYNTTVTLTATPSTGSTFAGWSGTGGCTGTGTCVLTMTAAKAATATFTLNTYTLSYTKAGTGAGTVVSSPAGINSAASTTADFNYNTTVTLTATPSTGSTFAGWSGAGGCTGTGTCVLTMTAAKAATATFTLNTYALTVTKAGTGTGTVTSSPAGISCGATCAYSFDYNTTVTLTATPSAGTTFAGWSGAGGCTGTGTCVLTMTAAKAATATFTLNQYALTVTKAGTGSGTITSSPAGINCGVTCSANYDYNTTVTLTVTPSVSTFSWTVTSGTCTGSVTPCTVTMAAARAVTATFTSTGPPDADGDGVPDSQDTSPNDNKVATPAAPTTGTITVNTTANAGTSLTSVSAVADTDDSLVQDNKPDVIFPYGIVKFTVNGVANGATAVVTLTFPDTLPANTKYYKVTSAGFVEFPGAVVSGNTITLTLTDGVAPGDSTAANDGKIVDPGGPGAPDGTAVVANYDGGSSSGCFIATAAYGSYQEPHVWILRQFRDRILLTNRAGEAFVKLYYRTSPPLADYISRHDSLRTVTRTALLPLYGFAQLTLALGPAGSMVFFGMILTLGVTGVVVRRRKRE